MGAAESPSRKTPLGPRYSTKVGVRGPLSGKATSHARHAQMGRTATATSDGSGPDLTEPAGAGLGGSSQLPSSRRRLPFIPPMPSMEAKIQIH